MPSLSPRQMECLKWLAEGATDQELAVAMYVEIATAKQHVHDVRIKLGARNRAHAVAIGFRTGVLK